MTEKNDVFQFVKTFCEVFRSQILHLIYAAIGTFLLVILLCSSEARIYLFV